MKKFIVGLMLISSISAQASLEAAMQDRSSDVLKQAMNIELDKMTENSFRCDFDPYLVMGYQGDNIKKQVKRIVNYGEMSIWVDEYLRNPAPYARYELRGVLTSIHFFLSKDSKKVERIHLLNQKQTTKDINSGTLLKPNIKTVQVLKTHLDGHCEIDY